MLSEVSLLRDFRNLFLILCLWWRSLLPVMAGALVNSGGITYETSLSFEAQESPLQ